MIGDIYTFCELLKAETFKFSSDLFSWWLGSKTWFLQDGYKSAYIQLMCATSSSIIEDERHRRLCPSFSRLQPWLPPSYN